eukprot:GGOE01053833.1.p1 GENE.GGOE01053833.1~~GGOE01053833.1.p1  ORF type:complete len:435 (+),score=62.37 GGOE01053833.1:21-1325(+)
MRIHQLIYFFSVLPCFCGMQRSLIHPHERSNSQPPHIDVRHLDGSSSHICVVAGSSHRGLAERIAAHLGLEICHTICEKFSNTECRVEILTNVRACDVYIVQTGGFTATGTINDHLIELLILIDACRRSHSSSINVIMPCFPYGRQDKKDRPRAPMSGQLVANLLQTAGATRLMLMDLHAAQIQGFFNIPVDNLYCLDLLCDHLRYCGYQRKEEYVMVSPHTSGAKRCFSGAKKMGLRGVIMDTRRDPATGERTTSLLSTADEVAGKHCIVLDDVADTLGTVLSAVRTLIASGAKDVILAVTHGLFSGSALERVNREPAITKVIVSNTVPQERNLQLCPKLEVVDVSEFISRAIRIMQCGGSLSALFDASDRLGTSLDMAKGKNEHSTMSSPTEVSHSAWDRDRCTSPVVPRKTAPPVERSVPSPPRSPRPAQQ